MMDVTLSLLALIAGGFTLQVYATRAPLGSQDERGLQFGKDARQGIDDSQSGNPS